MKRILTFLYCLFQLPIYAQAIYPNAIVEANKDGLQALRTSWHKSEQFGFTHKTFGEFKISNSRVCLMDSSKLAYDILVLDSDSVLHGLVNAKKREELERCIYKELPKRYYGWFSVTNEYKSQILVEDLRLLTKHGQKLDLASSDLISFERIGEAFRVELADGTTIIAFILNQQLEFAGKFERLAIPVSYLSSYRMAHKFRAKAEAETRMQYDWDLGSFFLNIPPGTFQMGLNVELSLSGDESPSHRVTIPRSFQVDISEFSCKSWAQVSRAFEWRDFVNCSAENRKSVLTGVSYLQIQEIIKVLNYSQVFWIYRLPTESEWEYLAFIHEKTLLSPTYDQKDSVGYLNQLLGGAWEMTASSMKPYNLRDRIDSQSSTVETRVVYRGGSDHSLVKTRNRFYRGSIDISKSSNDLGFRLVRERRK